MIMTELPVPVPSSQTEDVSQTGNWQPETGNSDIITFMDSALSPDERAALQSLASDLGRVFGARLRSVVAYGLDTPATPRLLHALALVDRLAFDDLVKCLPAA